MRKSYNSQNNSILDYFGEKLSIHNVKKYSRNQKLETSSRLLDLGCGYHSSVTKPIWNNFQEIHLVDFQVDSNIDKYRNKCFIHEGDAILKIKSFEDSYFDVVIANNILEHIVEDEILVNNIQRILKPGGLVIANVPNWIGKVFLEFSAFKLKLSPKEEIEDHQRYYSKHDLWLLMRSCGFLPSKIKVKTTKFGLNTFIVCSK